jgi:hypothetical protein
MIDFMKRKQFLVAFILIVFLFFIIFRPQTKADLVYFYPQTCLGSFVNPEKAQGEREVESPDLINELNSAVYYSGFKEIYCGNFQGPIKEGEIKKVTLHFNWVITKELREKPVIESTSSESLIEKIIPSKTIEINVGTSDVPIIQNNTNSNESNNTNTNSNELNNIKTNSNESTNTNGNELNNTNTNESQTATSLYEDNKKSKMSALSPNQSAYLKFINFAFAQNEKQNELQRISEANGNESNNINTNGNEFNNTNTNSNESNQTNGNESQTATSSYENINQSEESVLSPNQSTPKTLFDIHYTLDSQNWNYLGSVNESNWQNLTFDIPINNWLDISKIQIKINSLPDTDYYLYLESIWLEVEYISKNKEIVEEEKDIYGEYLAKIDLTKEEFTLEEIPQFNVLVFEKDKEDILNQNIATDTVSTSKQNIVEEPIVIDEKLKIKLKVLNSENEVIYKTDNYIYEKENDRLIFNLNDFNFYPDNYVMKVYVNNFLAGEGKFKISGEIIKKEPIDSNQHIVFLKNKEKYQIWFLEQNQNNSWEKIYEGDFIPPYSISNKYFLYVLDNALYGYSFESKTYFSQSLEPYYSTIISINGRNFKVKYYQNSLILNEIFQNEETQNF